MFASNIENEDLCSVERSTRKSRAAADVTVRMYSISKTFLKLIPVDTHRQTEVCQALLRHDHEPIVHGQ